MEYYLSHSNKCQYFGPCSKTNCTNRSLVLKVQYYGRVCAYHPAKPRGPWFDFQR